MNVSQLMQQLQRSEKALADTEDKLKLTQKELGKRNSENRPLVTTVHDFFPVQVLAYERPMILSIDMVCGRC